jgi:hypothetical protein
MNDVFLKKIETSIDEALKRKNPVYNLDPLFNYITQKINTNSTNEEMTISLENILIVRVYNLISLRNYSKEDSGMWSKVTVII